MSSFSLLSPPPSHHVFPHSNGSLMTGTTTTAATKPFRSSPLASTSSPFRPQQPPEQTLRTPFPSSEPDSDSQTPSSPSTDSFYSQPLPASVRPHPTRPRPLNLPPKREYQSRQSTRSPAPPSLISSLLERPPSSRSAPRPKRIVPPRDPDANPFDDIQPGGFREGEWEEYSADEELMLGREVGRWEKLERRRRRDLMEGVDDWAMNDIEEGEFDDLEGEEEEQPPPDIDIDSSPLVTPSSLFFPPTIPHLAAASSSPSYSSTHDDSTMSDLETPFQIQIDTCPKCRSEVNSLASADDGGALCMLEGCDWNISGPALARLEEFWDQHASEEEADVIEHRMLWHWSSWTGTSVFCAKDGCDGEFAL